MAQIIDIRRVEVGPKSFTARVRVAMGAPLMTSEDLEGTTRVYRLLPHIIEHVCLGDTDGTFKEVMGDTEIAHLLEHVTVELLAQTNIAGDIACGRTWAVEDERRTYDVEFPCPDDVLMAGALASAVWVLQWAYSGGIGPEPDIEATVEGLVGLVQSLPEPPAPRPSVREYMVYGEEARAFAEEEEEPADECDLDVTLVTRPLDEAVAKSAEGDEAPATEVVTEPADPAQDATVDYEEAGAQGYAAPWDDVAGADGGHDYPPSFADDWDEAPDFDDAQ